MADTGVKFPGTAATGGSGFTAWSSPDNAKTDNSQYAQYQVGNYSVFTTTSSVLTVSNFALSVPTGATIDGIKVEVQAYYINGLRPCHDYRVQLKIGGSAQGDNKATLADFTTSETTRTYGGSTDKWGLTTPLTVTNLNDTGFGVEFVGEGNFNGANQSGYCRIDCITVQVYYTEAGGGYTLTATNLAVPVSRKSATLTTSRSLTATSKSIPVSLKSANLAIGKILTATSKAIPVTKNSATLTASRKLSATSKAIPVSLQSTNLTASRKLTATSKAIPATLNSANLTVGSGTKTLTATSKAIPVTNNSVNLTVSRKITATSKSIPVNRNSATLTRTRKITATSKAISTSLKPAFLIGSRKLTATSLSVPVSLKSAVLTRTRKISATSKAVAVSLKSATLKASRKLTAISKAIPVTRYSANLTIVGSGSTLTATSKAIPVSLGTAILRVSRKLSGVTLHVPVIKYEALLGIDYYDHTATVYKEVFDVVTATEICNQALGLVGAYNMIRSLTDQTTEALTCLSHYGSTRNELMQGVNWSFLRVQRSLALLASASGTDENPDGAFDLSEDGWLYTYAYPSDCLEPIMIKPSADGALTPEFSNMGALRDGQNSTVPFIDGARPNPNGGGYQRIINTNKQKAILIYQADITDTSIFPPDFLALFKVTLASKLATALGNMEVAKNLLLQSSGMMDKLKAKYAVQYVADKMPLVYDPVSEYLKSR